MHDEKIAEACQCELHAHGNDDQPHEPRCRVTRKATSCAASPAGHEHHHDVGNQLFYAFGFAQPTQFELAVNLGTAKAMALTIPESFLLRADALIE